VVGAAPHRPGLCQNVEQEDPCCQAMIRFSLCGRATTKTSHHLNVIQWQKTGESFMYVIGRCVSTEQLSETRSGLHRKLPTYQPCKTVSQGAATLEQGLPPHRPTRTTASNQTYGANQRSRSTSRRHPDDYFGTVTALWQDMILPSYPSYIGTP
jgi:hypothetical protein